jgi:hypothetical protein
MSQLEYLPILATGYLKNILYYCTLLAWAFYLPAQWKKCVMNVQDYYRFVPLIVDFFPA